MNTIDPLDRARKALYTDCLKTWLECWRDTPPDECQGMVRGYIDAHLLDRGVALPTEEDVEGRICAAEDAEHATSRGEYSSPENQCIGWIDRWRVIDGLWSGRIAFCSSSRSEIQACMDWIEDAKEKGYSPMRFTPDSHHIDRRTEFEKANEASWWCALYARYGRRIFWGEGYT